MDSVSLRRATEADLNEVLTLYHAFHAFHVRGLPEWLRMPANGDWGDDATREQLRGILRDTNAALFAAEAGGALIGLAEVYMREDEDSALVVEHRYGYVQSLFVVEQRRGSGVGRRLLGTCEQWSLERGATQMRLSIWEFANDPLGFYEAVGYTTIKRTLTRRLRT